MQLRHEAMLIGRNKDMRRAPIISEKQKPIVAALLKRRALRKRLRSLVFPMFLALLGVPGVYFWLLFLTG